MSLAILVQINSARIHGARVPRFAASNLPFRFRIVSMRMDFGLVVRKGFGLLVPPLIATIKSQAHRNSPRNCRGHRPNRGRLEAVQRPIQRFRIVEQAISRSEALTLLCEQKLVFTECFDTADPTLISYTARVKTKLDSNVNFLVSVCGERGWKQGYSDLLQYFDDLVSRCFEYKLNAKRQDVTHAP